MTKASRYPGAPSLVTLLALAWPMIVARSSQAVVGLSDALMTAPLGEGALAAVTTGAINLFSIVILPMGLVFIVQSFAAQLTGRGDLAGARRYAYYGLALSVLAAAVAAAVIPLVPLVLAELDYEAAVESQMTDYLEIRLLAVGFIVAAEALGNWFGGLGRTKLHMNAGLITMVINVGLNWLLIEGNLGAPALGVRGAAIASVVASIAGLAYLVAVFVAERPASSIGKLRASELWRVVRFGFPNGLSWFLEFAALVLYINVVIAHLGTTTLAAMMVVFNVNSVSFMPAFGLATAGSILAGQAIGEGDKDRVKPTLWLTMRVAVLWQCTVGAAYLIAPAAIMWQFAPPDIAIDASLIAIGATMLALSAGWQLFDGIGLTLTETLRAAGDTTWPLLARLGLAWLLFVPLSITAVFVLDGGYVIAMLCIVIYIAGLSAFLGWRFLSGAWRDIDLTGQPEIPV